MKFIGCAREFGFFEAVRRAKKEFKRVGNRNSPLDISWITERLAIGAAPKTKEALIQLTRSGVNHLIDLRGERKPNDVLADSDELAVYWVPAYDDWLPKNTKLFLSLSGLCYSLIRNSNGKLAICCGAGEHRAPLGGAVALLTMGYSLDDAIEMIKKSRSVAEFLPVYVTSLKNNFKLREK